jgi:predicted ATPase
MVRRDQELALLLERWAQAQAGEGQAVLLVGEAGIGKSRLASALLDACANRPHEPIRWQCSPYHANSALWPVIQRPGPHCRSGASPRRPDNPKTSLMPHPQGQPCWRTASHVSPNLRRYFRSRSASFTTER